MVPMPRPLLVLIIVALLAGCASRVITARHFHVERVIDGDTLVIVYDGERTSIRLARVNAPERNERGGAEATEALRQLVDGKTVRIAFTAPHGRKRDNFGRLLCSVYVNGVDVESELVREDVASWQDQARQ